MNLPHISTALLLLAIFFSACEPRGANRQQRLIQRAEMHLAAGDAHQAVRYFEAALDGTTESAPLHYRLGVIYDDHLREPVPALAHFRRYLILQPEGRLANDAQAGIQRVQAAALAELAEGNLITRSEAVRLKNENLSLRQEIARLRAAARQGGRAAPSSSTTARTYEVQAGDTLAAISRKFYNTSARWQDILDANRDQLQGPGDLRVGQTLVIP